MLRQRKRRCRQLRRRAAAVVAVVGVVVTAARSARRGLFILLQRERGLAVDFLDADVSVIISKTNSAANSERTRTVVNDC